MRNLAGVEGADEFIQEELFLAGIDLVLDQKSTGEVPYTILGKVNDWKFERAWYYWIASTEDGKGLPLKVAIDLHEREYPLKGEKCPDIYGREVRTEGFAGGIHPIDWNIGTADSLEAELQKLKKDPEKLTRKNIFTLYNQGNLKGDKSVDSYHIDSQVGLNELVRVIKETN